MMDYQRLTITTAADGTATAYTKAFNGLVHGFYLERDATDAPDATLDVTITDQVTGAALLTITNLAASGRYLPTDLVDDLVGADRAGIATRVPVSGQIKVVLAQGGAAKKLHVHSYVVEE
jgi:hypothetical protein